MIKYEIGQKVKTIRGVGFIVNMFHRDYDNFSINEFLIVFDNGITEPFTEDELNLFNNVK